MPTKNPPPAESVDSVRRKLIRSGLVAGGGFALGQFPYQSPAVKSFSGTRSAYAQPTGPSCGVVSINPIAKASHSGSLAFQASNTGTAPFDITGLTTSDPAFVVTEPTPPVTLGPGDSVDITVEVICTSPGPQSGQLNIATNFSPGCASVPLNFDCPPLCEIVPPGTDFGIVPIGTTAPRTLTVRSLAQFEIDLTAVEIRDTSPPGEGGGGGGALPFSASATLPTTLQPGDSTDVTVEFVCNTPGEASAELAFTFGSAFGPIDCPPVPLSAICPDILCEVSPLSLDFGFIPVGGSDTEVIAVQNNGGSDFDITAATVDDAAFVVTTALPLTVGSGQQVALDIEASCQAAGDISGTLTITAMAGQVEVTCEEVALTATCGDEASCVFEPDPFDFGFILFGETATRSVFLRNLGDVFLDVTEMTSDNPAFELLTGVPLRIAPDGSEEIFVRVTCPPGGSGAPAKAATVLNGSLSLVASGELGPVDCGPLDMIATCIAIGCEVSPSSLDFGDVLVGDTATETLTISNTGDIDFDLTDLVSTDAAFAPQATLPLTVPAGGSVMVDVEFSCAASGNPSGELSLTTNSAVGPVDCAPVPLSGNCLEISCAVEPESFSFTGGFKQDTFDIINTGDVAFSVDALNVLDNFPFPDAIRVLDPTTFPQTLNPGDRLTVTFEAFCEDDFSSAEIEIVATTAAGDAVPCANVPVRIDCD